MIAMASASWSEVHQGMVAADAGTDWRWISLALSHDWRRGFAFAKRTAGYAHCN